MKRQKIGPDDLAAIRRIHEGGISIGIIADEIGVSYHTVYYWLNGKNTPGYLVAQKIKDFVENHTLPARVGGGGQ